MRIWAVALSLALPLGVTGGAAAAPPTTMPAPGAVTPQTGPSGPPEASPPYERPSPPLMLPQPQPQPPPATEAGGTVTLVDVRVDADPAIGRARALSSWRAPAVAAGGLGLRLQPGERMNAGWVRRQFVINRLIGQPTTADRVVSLVLMVNEAYAQNGYVNSGLLVLPQDWSATGAVLQLRLVAGRFVHRAGAPEAVTWGPEGDQRLRPGFLLDRLPAATEAPLNVVELERDFRSLADNPAIRTLNAVVTPDKVAGQADLAITATPQTWADVYYGVANDRNPSVGATRAFVGGTFRNMLDSGDLLALDAGATRGLVDAYVDYATPFVIPDATFNLVVTGNRARVLDPALLRLNVRSAELGVEGGLALRLVDDPLMPVAGGAGWTPARTLTIGVRLARRFSESWLLGQPFSFSPGSENGVTNLTVFRAAADWVQRSDREVAALSVIASAGVRGTFVDLPNQPSPHFHVLLVQANYARRLTPEGLEFKARFVGQAASGPLYPMEQLSAGGEETVRGYPENLLLADEGVIGSLELGCPLAVGARPCAAPPGWQTVRLAVFAEAAYLRNRTRLQPQPNHVEGVGIGATWTPLSGILAQIEYGRALTPSLSSGPGGLEKRGVDFSLVIHPLLIRHGT